MPLWQFRIKLADTLCKFQSIIERGRPRSGTFRRQIEEAIKLRNTREVYPPHDIRLDGIDHFPGHHETKKRCKFPGCESQTRTFCTKCGVSLCFTGSKNCFVQFHEQKFIF